VIGSSSRGGKHRAGSGSGAAPSTTTGHGPLPPTKPKTKATKRKGFLRRWWWAFVLPPVLLLVGGFGVLWYVYAHTPIPEFPTGEQTTLVYDRAGKLVATLHGTINRIEVPLSDISPDLQHAVIAIEDKDFYHHGGVSFVSILRAGWADLTHGSVQQGGSTITQQYVKNVFTGGERTVARKVKEAIIAVKLEKAYSKDQILEKYLNTIYLGHGAYGVEAASKYYFGKSAKDLDPLQSATLAGLIAAPSSYDPIDHPDQNRVRRNVVLDDMAQQGYLTQGDAARLKQEPIKVKKKHPTFESSKYAYFVSFVSDTLQQRFGSSGTFSGGLRVTTTLDSAYQQAAEDAVASHLPSAKDPSAALVAIDPATGEIRALVGGRDFTKVKFNNATQAQRQAGSSFKPFTLATAIEQKISPFSTWSGPSQITIDDPICENPDGTPWEPHNYGDESGGTMNLIQATAHSVNTIFAQLVVKVGPQNVADTAHAAGIASDLQPVCSITLGTQPVTPLEMADAYATFAARGVHHPPLAITEVKDAKGAVLDSSDVESDRAMPANDADIVTAALQAVVTEGTGTGAQLDRPAAGKTGTTQNNGDAWFCGYVPQLVTCVWVGYQKGSIPLENVEGVPLVFGGSIPAEIWHDFMTTALQDVPVRNFRAPNYQGFTTPSPTGSPSASPSASTTESPSPRPTESPSSSPSPSESPSPSLSESPTPTGSASPGDGFLFEAVLTKEGGGRGGLRER
jgi:penicillin-binding protein 1A